MIQALQHCRVTAAVPAVLLHNVSARSMRPLSLVIFARYSLSLAGATFFAVMQPAKVNLGAAAAAIAAAALIVAPVNAADIKTVVCASNPTAKICLKDSGKP